MTVTSRSPSSFTLSRSLRSAARRITGSEDLVATDRKDRATDRRAYVCWHGVPRQASTKRHRAPECITGAGAPCARREMLLDLHAGRLIDLGAHICSQLLRQLGARLRVVSIAEHTRELGARRHPGPMQPALERSNLDADHLGRLFGAQAFHVAQDGLASRRGS